MEKQVKETGLQYYKRLKEKAISLGLSGKGKTPELEAAIAEATATGSSGEPVVIEETIEKPKDGKISVDEAKAIRARLLAEEEIRDQIRAERAIINEHARITAESETLKIPSGLPLVEVCSEIDLARARTKLSMTKLEVKPSPETVAIENSQRGYYIFTNREQDDAAHTVNPGSKYTIHLIPDMVHVLSKFHIDFFRQKAVYPVYKRMPTGVVPGPNTVGQAAEKCVRVAGKPRFAFEYLGNAPDDAEFGMVLDQKILEEIIPKVEQFV